MSESSRESVKRSEAGKEKKTSQKRISDDSLSANSIVDRILFLKRTIGNQAISRLFKSGALKAKLKIGQPDDIYEQEADRVAEQVMRMPESQIVSGNNFHIQRACPKCEEKLKQQPIKEEEKLQAKTASSLNHDVDPGIENHIQSIKGGGNPLSESERAFFEPRFGHDFSHVRVDCGRQAEQAARSINAKAYAVGNHIVFGGTQLSPTSREGQQLLAHELTHVIQQSGASGIHAIGRQEHHGLLQRTPDQVGADQSTQQRICGPDITTSLTTMLGTVEPWFRGLTGFQQSRSCMALGPGGFFVDVNPAWPGTPGSCSCRTPAGWTPISGAGRAVRRGIRDATPTRSDTCARRPRPAATPWS